MGSRRLPGKVMKKIHGIPMLLRVLERVSYLDVCDKIIVSTTLKEKDDEIVSLIKNQKFLNKEIFILEEMKKMFWIGFTRLHSFLN